MKTFWCAVALFLATTVSAQNVEPSAAVKKFIDDTDPIYEYGDATDLKDITKIFVDTGMKKDLRDQVVQQIAKHLPQIQVVKRRQEAQVFLVLDGWVRRIAGPQKERWGEGWIFIVPDSKTIRVLASFEQPREEYIVGASPAEAFADLFVREFRKGNPVQAPAR